MRVPVGRCVQADGTGSQSGGSRCSHRPERGLGPVGDAEPLKDARQVGFHGAFCDAELAGDLLVGEAIADELEHFAFAVGQLGCVLSGAPRLKQCSCRFRIEW